MASNLQKDNKREQYSPENSGAAGEVLGPQLQQLLNSAEDFLFVINTGCRYTEAFGRGMIRLGLSPADFIGKTPVEVFGEETGAQLLSFYEEAVNGQTVSYEWSGATEDGFLFFQSKLSPVIDKHNEVIGAVGMVRDITATKKLEKELRANEERLRFALEGAQAGVWDWDMVDDELYFSKRWKAMIGYEEDELPNTFTMWEKLLHPDDKDRILFVVQSFIASKETEFEAEYRMRHKDGSYRWILTKGSLQRSSGGRPVRWAGSNIDISRRKQSDKELAENEQLFREMFEKHPSLKLLVEPKTGKIVEANPAAAGFYGFTTDTLKQMTLQELGQSSTVLEETGNSKTRYILMRHRLAGGELRDVEARICRITFRGRELIYAIIHDISDRERARKWLSDNLKFLEILLDTIPLPVFYKDKNGIYRGCNKTFAEMIYGTSKENVIGRSISEFPAAFSKEYAEFTDAKDRQLLADGGVQTYEASIKCADGRLREFILSKAVFYDHSNLTAGLVGTMIDITERNLAERDVKESEAKYQALSGNVPGVLYQWYERTNGERGYYYISPKVEELFGVQASELIEDFNNLPLHEKDVERWTESIAAAVNNKSKWEFEGRYVLPDGSTKWWQGVSQPVEISDQEIVFHGLIIDITERKRTEEQLKLQSAVMEAAANAIVITSKDGSIEWVNPAFTELTGYTAEEAQGQNPRVLKSGHHNDEFYQSMWDTILSGNVWRSEMINRHKDGHHYFEEMTITPLQNSDGEIENFVAIKNDITERKQAENTLKKSEEKFRSLAEGINEVFWLRTPDKMLYINPAYERVWGKSRQSLYEQPYSFMESIHPEDRGRVMGQFRSERFLNEGRFDEVYRIIRGDGEVRWIWARTFFVSKDGEEMKTGGIAEDVTDLRKTERALQESNATKDKFFSIIAHDLKNPFQTLITLSNMMGSKYAEMSEQKQLHYINEIRKTSQHSYQLLENLLQWSRAQTNRLEISPAPMDMATLAMEISFLTKTQADNKGIEIISSVEPGFVAFADHNMIRTVLRNLVTNAIKFSGEGSTIRISVRQTGSEIVTSVADQGVGIEPEKLPLLFRIDEAVSTPGTEQERGTGLGLILCEEFVKKNSGSISVESQPGKGSTFSFSLPRAAD